MRYCNFPTRKKCGVWFVKLTYGNGVNVIIIDKGLAGVSFVEMTLPIK